MTLVIPPKGTRCMDSDDGCQNAADVYAEGMDVRQKDGSIVHELGEPLCRECARLLGEKVLSTCDCGCGEETAGPLDGPAYASQECADRDERSARS